MRRLAPLVPLLVLATMLLPSRVGAQDPTTPPPTTQPPSTPPPAPTTPPAPAPATATTPAAAKPEPSNNFWLTLSGSVSQPNDSFSDLAEMGSQFLGGVHRRLSDRLTLGLTLGAANWSGVDIQFYHDVQVTLDARFHITRPESRMRPFVQVGYGKYQVVSEAEVEGAEPERSSESSMGVNFGGGVLFAVGKTARLGPVVFYHSAGAIPEIGSLVGKGDFKFISFGVELLMPMGR